MQIKKTLQFFCVLSLSCCFVLQATAQQKKTNQHPNIIIFIVDDMGWQDCSVPFWNQTTDFNRRYRTPNMERLAAEGMKLTNAYATPVCSPSRVSLMTGMNAAHHKVTNWTLRKDQTVDYPDSILQSPDWNVNGLSPVEGINHTVYATALPALLKGAGYYTVHCGKAHFGAMGTPAEDPRTIGFDINIAGHAAGGPGSYLGEENYGNKKDEQTEPWGVPGLVPYHGTDVFLTEALTREAIKAIDVPVKKKQPFFLYMAHYAVHIPYAPDKRFVEKYLAMGLKQKEAEYAALVEGMDKSLGDLMNYLQQNKLDQNTIILFISDNGGFAMKPRSGEQFTQNAPLRSGKGSVYEGGIRVPMLVKWPGVIKPKSATDQYVIIEDLFPTVLQMAGINQYRTVQQVDGKTLIPFLKNASLRDTSRILTWHFPNRWIPENGPGINYKSAVRKGKWKLVYDLKTGKRELYNLETDISEVHDLSAQFPAKLNELSLLLSTQLRQWNAQMPVIKSTGETVPLPGNK